MPRYKESLYSVFIADDNPENLNLLSTVLEKEGYRTRAATNGEQALESIRLLPPDIILLDVHMPKMDGYETCRRLKSDEGLADIPVLFISALDEPYNRIAGFEAGGLDYIAKPYNTAEILARVKTHIQLSTKTRELKASLETLSRCQDNLILAEKQNYLGKLISSMGHELNTPLGNVIMSHSQIRIYAEEMLKNAEDGAKDGLEKLLEINAIAGSALEHMKDIIDRFRLLGENGPDVDIADMSIRESLGLLPGFFRGIPDFDKMTIESEIPEDLRWTYGYQAFFQILVSLVKNSLDHSGLEPEELVVKIEMSSDEEKFRLRFADNGEGVGEDAVPLIFDPFFTTRRHDSFMGLGLHMVYLIVSRLGGALVYSEGGPGAVFEVTLPVRESENPY